MNNLEKEYKQMIDEQMPDLWSRIEPALHEKKPQPIASPVTSFETKAAGKKNIKRYIPLISGVAVAAVALIVTIPMFAGNIAMKNASFHSSATSEAETSSMAESSKDAGAYGDYAESVAADSACVAEEESYYMETEAAEEACESNTVTAQESESEDVYEEYDGVVFEQVDASQLPDGYSEDGRIEDREDGSYYVFYREVAGADVYDKLMISVELYTLEDARNLALEYFDCVEE